MGRQAGRWSRIISSLLLIAAGQGALLPAQDARGRITGKVTDASGGGIPGAEVTVTNATTGVVLRATPAASGNYEVPYLAPGLYTVRVSAAGFKSHERANLEVRVADRLTIDVTLEVGAVTESVTVSGQASLLETNTASLGRVVDTKRILELPLPGGNALSLSRLAPGVVNLGVPNHPSLGPAVEVLSSLSVNGVRSGNIEFTVDGSPSMWGQNAAYAPPTDMVAEFKVQTATYDASSGRAPGGNVNVVLRSGTNKFHTTLYHFHNNQVLTAMDLFQRQLLANPSTAPTLEERRQRANPRNILNRFGGNFGGPVVLPKVYDGHNKTFWVYGFEGLTRPGIERGNSFYTVPTTAMQRGDFRDLLQINASYQIYDPATIAAAPNGRFSRQPFAGNVIPASRIDRTAAALLQYWPAPNSPGTNDGRNNFQRLPQSWNEFRSHTAKVDHNFSERHRAFVRYNQTYNLFTSGQVFDNPYTGNDRYRRNKGIGLDDVFVFSPRLLANFRWGFTRFEQAFSPLAAGFDMTSVGFSKQLYDAIDPQARNFPQLAIANIQTLGNGSNSRATSNYHVWASDWTLSRGKHTIRSGAEYRLFREHNYNFTPMNPQLSFGVTWTRGPLDNSPAAPNGQGLASFLLGLPTDGQINVNDSLAEQSKTLAFYLQDDWRVSSRLTLNFGMRYDVDSPATERFNRSIRNFDASVPNPIDAVARTNYTANPIPEIPASQFRALGGLTFAGAGGQPRTLWKADRNNFAPRIGLAWSAAKKTVVRTGYGVYFVPLGVDRSSVNQSGYSIRNALVPSLNNGLTFLASLANPFPGGFALPAGPSGGLATDVGRSISFFNPEPANGYMQRYSFGIQQEVPGEVLVDISYVGNRGTKLGVSRGINPVPNQYLSTTGTRDQATIDRLSQQVRNPFFPLLAGTDLAAQTVARSQLLRPFPHYSGVSVDQSIGYSWYHSLQVQGERRFRRGFTMQFNYTWSKFMEATGFLNGGDARLEEVISDLDRQHRVTGSGIWELPLGSGRKWLSSAPAPVRWGVSGWQLQAVWQRNTGAPLGFGNALLTGDIRDAAIGGGAQTLDQWFNTAVFNRVAAQQLASNLRTVSSRFSGVRAPGQETWDISGVKNFAFRERYKVQFRAEFLNALNKSNLAAPNTDPVNTLFGRVTATSGFPRQIHLGLKLLF